MQNYESYKLSASIHLWVNSFAKDDIAVEERIGLTYQRIVEFKRLTLITTEAELNILLNEFPGLAVFHKTITLLNLDLTKIEITEMLSTKLLDLQKTIFPEPED